MTDKTAPEQEAPLTDGKFCLACNKAGHFTTECWSTMAVNTAEAQELCRLILAFHELVEARAALAPQPKGTRPLTEPLWCTKSQAFAMMEAAVRLRETAGDMSPPESPELSMSMFANREDFERAKAAAPRPLVSEPPIAWRRRIADQWQYGVWSGNVDYSDDGGAPYEFLWPARLSPAPSITPEPDQRTNK